MTDYTFETMTPAQALAYNAATDTLHFSTPTVGGLSSLLGFNPDGTISFSTNVGSLTFGPGLLGEQQIYFGDGSRMAIGGPGDDLLIGAATNDYLAGGPGNDTINGGAGVDREQGGPGSDLFITVGLESHLDTIVDFETVDFLALNGISGTPSNFMIFGKTDIDHATQEAHAAIESGQAEFVAVQVNDYTVVWADINNSNIAGVEVVLNNFQASTLTYHNFVPFPAISGAPIPPLTSGGTSTAPPPPVFQGAYAVSASIQGNMDTAVIPDVPGELVSISSHGYQITGDGVNFQVFGHDLTFSAAGDITGGVVSSMQLILSRPFFELNFSVDASVDRPPTPIDGDTLQTLFPGIFSAGDNIQGSASADLLRGYGGNDLLAGVGGGDTIFGGTGDDVIFADLPPTARGVATSGPSYLRGEEGDDYIQGGTSFDDINGNQGNDTASGGAGNDWVVGGKDHDLLFGDAGDDIVWGNLGNDTLDGGDGNDQIRGGQGDDIVNGGAGNDYVSGDRGNDTITGGAGADIFHDSQDAGIDRVLDFSLADGDKVMLDPGTTFTVSQVGADTVIDMGGGNQMILVGVQASSLPVGTIFLG